MLTRIFILFIFLTGFSIQAQQVDRRQNSIPIPAEKVDDSIDTDIKIEPEETEEDPSPNLNNILPKENPAPINPRTEREFSMIEEKKLRDPGEIFEKRYAKQAVEQGIMIEKMSDQFLGEFKSNGKFVNIVCRDHEYPDGDLVRVFVNGEIFVPTLLLTSGYKGFNIPLTPGANTIEFLALNQGDSGPNTAEFQVYDDNKNLVSSKKWNLLTGVKATIIVYKDLEKEE